MTSIPQNVFHIISARKVNPIVRNESFLTIADTYVLNAELCASFRCETFPQRFSAKIHTSCITKIPFYNSEQLRGKSYIQNLFFKINCI